MCAPDKKYIYGMIFYSGECYSLISIGNYMVREVLMKNRTRVWRNVYNRKL